VVITSNQVSGNGELANSRNRILTEPHRHAKFNGIQITKSAAAHYWLASCLYLRGLIFRELLSQLTFAFKIDGCPDVQQH
jgi:hypothetical protein